MFDLKLTFYYRSNEKSYFSSDANHGGSAPLGFAICVIAGQSATTLPHVTYVSMFVGMCVRYGHAPGHRSPRDAERPRYHGSIWNRGELSP